MSQREPVDVGAILVKAGATITMDAERFLELVEPRPVDNAPAPAPDPRPDDRLVVSLNIPDISRQIVRPNVVLPAEWRATWELDCPEPPPSDDMIQVTILEIYQGKKWIGRRRISVFARRPEGALLWEIHVGTGVVLTNGRMLWSRPTRKLSRAAWSAVLNGSIRLTGGRVFPVVGGTAAPQADLHSFDASWISDGPVVVQVGHRDQGPEEGGKGDEPFPRGTGLVQIADIYGDDDETREIEPLDVEPDNAATEAEDDATGAYVEEIVGDMIGADEAPASSAKRATVSGERGAGYSWVWPRFTLADLERDGWPHKLGEPLDQRAMRRDPVPFMVGTAVQMIRANPDPAWRLSYLLAIRRWQGDAPTFTEEAARAAAGVPPESAAAKILRRAEGAILATLKELREAIREADTGAPDLARLTRVTSGLKVAINLVAESRTAAARKGIDR